MTTILRPDDVLKVGDIVHWKRRQGTMVIDGLAGRPVNYLTDDVDLFDFAERPDPVVPDAERVRILREALEFYANFRRTTPWGVMNRVEVDGEIARAALEATK